MEEVRKDLILEAIWDKGCRSIKAISKTMGIDYQLARKIINKADLLEELREMKKKDIYERARISYNRECVGNKKFEQMIGVNYANLPYYKISLKKIKGEFTDAQKNLVYVLDQIVLKKAQEKDIAFYYAYVFYNKIHGRLNFKETYKRSKDILEGHAVSECGRRWNVSRQAASQFIDRIEMREIHRKKASYHH